MQLDPLSLTDSIPGSFSGKVAVVTGGGRGIGAATARLFAKLGARVAIVSRTESEVTSTVQSIREDLAQVRGAGEIHGLVLDLSLSQSVKPLFEFAENKFGSSVEILVNNAAIGYAVPFVASSEEVILREWERIQAINIRAPLLLSHEFMRRLAQKKHFTSHGVIVNISSLGGIQGTEKFPGLALYVTTKAAICGMTEALAVEGKPIGVRVNAVAPGAVDTEMLRKAAPHLKTQTTPDDIAKVIISLCDVQDSRAVTGDLIEIHSNL